MATMSALSNRVHDIIRRMSDNLSQADATKTCYGILAIMSREEASKGIIAKNGLDIILSGMQTHMDKADVQEAGCDLLWSLAFNNAAIKEMIGNCNGTSVVVRSLKRHSKSPEFLKSACGALSNLCQYKVNQQGVASHGGLPPLINSITVHQRNAKLLPFIFDALASLIVGNEENARMVSSQEGITKILTATGAHKDVSEVVKSGCHALAILSDVKGQASKIAFAGGVSSILPLLDLHPAYPDFHRVAAVVLLRMLQESSHVVREIASNDGIRILLKSLDKGGAQQDTVAAITHILSTVTNPLAATTSSIESQLWVQTSSSSLDQDGDLSVGLGGAGGLHPANSRRGRFARNDVRYVVSHDTANSESLTSPVRPQLPVQRKHSKDVSALLGLVKLMGQYAERKDVARASCRLLNNLIGYAGVIMSLDNVGLLDKVFDCVNIHRNTKDILESAASLLKAIHKRTFPAFTGNKISSVRGLIHLVRCKVQDDEVVVAALEILQKLAESDIQRSQLNLNFSLTTPSYTLWEEEAVSLCVSILENATLSPLISSPLKNGTLDNATVPWTKTLPKLISAVLDFLECVSSHRNSNCSYLYPQSLSLTLQNLTGVIPSRHADMCSRIHRLLPHVQKYIETYDLSQEVELENPNKKIVLKQREVDDQGNGSLMDTSSSVKKKNSIVSLASDNGSVMTASSSEMMAKKNPNEMESSIRANRSKEKLLNRTEACESQVDSTQPMHPLKFYSQLPEDQRGRSTPQLISDNPPYLEGLASDCGLSVLSSVLGSEKREEDYMSGKLYQQAGENVLPSRMHLCYESTNPGGKDLVSRYSTPVPYICPREGVGLPFSHSLTFDSEFESGNLMRAVQTGEREYDLCLRSDVHTPGHTQWFYFAVSNTYSSELLAALDDEKPVAYPKYRFNITNLTKPDSLFNQGMRPVLYSCRDAKSKGIGWVRAGSNISYYSNQYQRNNVAGEGIACYFSLSFTLELANPRDTYLIAYCYPYTYSDNKAHMQHLLSKPGARDIMRHSVLCSTLGGVDCDLLVITNFKDKENLGPIHNMTNLKPNETYENNLKNGRKKAKSNRKALVISARVHPGETPASWIMKGALDFLTGNTPNAKLLRQAFVIYVVPMLNPDGVIYGNNRCGLAGVDLNRQWKIPMKALHPTVYALKTLIQEQRIVRDISMYIDLHGHSRKYNVFMYGCEEKKKSNPKVRAFPKFFSLHNIGKKYVSYADCSFHIRKGREATARVVVAREVGIPLSYTVEATFCGPDSGPLKFCHMNIGHFEEVGVALVDSFIQYSIAEGDVSDAIILSSRKGVTKPGVEELDLSNINDAALQKDILKSNMLTPLGAPDEIATGNDIDSSDVGDDDDSNDDVSFLDSVTTGGGGVYTEKHVEGEERIGGLEGVYSLRGVKTAGPSIPTRSAGIALLSSTGPLHQQQQQTRSRSETAPLPSPFVKDNGEIRMLARDDGFSFSETISANRMIAAASSNKPSTISAFSGDIPERTTFKETAVSMRPKKASRKSGHKSKKDKSASQKVAKQLNAVTPSSSNNSNSTSSNTDGNGFADGANRSSLIFGRNFLSLNEKDDQGEKLVHSASSKSKHSLLGGGHQLTAEESAVTSLALPKVNTAKASY